MVSRESAEKDLNDLLDATYAIAFIDTPHHGVNGLSLATTFGITFDTIGHTLLRDLHPKFGICAELQENFHVMLDTRPDDRKIQIFSFYEENSEVQPL